MTCECDHPVFPTPLSIAAGLDSLPRQIATFPELRTALLAAIPAHPALRAWRARGADDLGVMLLEMWAYVGDVLALYDKVIADESYVRTAKRRPSLRRLVGLLGYVPRPAVAASVRLGLLAEGKRAVSVPAGTAFRSTAFAGEPPQVFELDATAVIHPAFNKLSILPTRDPYLPTSFRSLLLVASTAKVKRGQHVLLQLGGDTFTREVAQTTRVTDSDGQRYVRVDLETPIVTSGPKRISEARLRVPTRSSPLRRTSYPGEYPPLYVFSGGAVVTLAGSYRQVHPPDPIVLSIQNDHRPFIASGVVDVDYVVTPSQDIDLGSGHVTVPAVKAAYTLLVVTPGINDQPGATGSWGNNDASAVTAWFDFVEGGTIAAAANPTLAATDPIVLSGLHVGPLGAPDPHRFLFVDDETRGVEVAGAIDVAASTLAPSGSPMFSPPLAAPVMVYGNVVDATRGERVASELLGSGDASLVDQSFTLAKGPLTYLPSVDGNDTGVSSTLAIRVDGRAWTEVPTFFGQPPDAPVFTVRENDGGKAVVAFGDGVHGARLPTGAGNVVASYRFGAGVKSPPAGSITQLARSVPGVQSVVNPVAAAGGADAEAAGSLRTLAPRSALLLGRAVSILDMEAAAAVVPGVRTATARWEWDGARQRPVVKIWYVGDAALAKTISQRLRSLSDPSTPFDVQRATIHARSLAIDLETDPRRIAADVALAVKTALLDPDRGLLAVERLGIAKPLFRSRIFEAVEAVPGALGVRGLWLAGAPFIAYGYAAPSGTYFSFEPTTTQVTGSPKEDVITA